ncbi:hypothetical protein ON010_g2064 [Phytophthora cinnamomi]|nr:hypothetical protein ON010_g2064 [Phytophthora cinnamomi]
MRNVVGIALLDELPDLRFDASDGRSSSLREYFLGSWGLLFSHPDDFTPICTSELGEVARLENAGEFSGRGVKLLALSCNDVASHKRWIVDIEKYSGAKVNYPIVADPQPPHRGAARNAITRRPGQGGHATHRSHSICAGPAGASSADADVPGQYGSQLCGGAASAGFAAAH